MFNYNIFFSRVLGITISPPEEAGKGEYLIDDVLFKFLFKFLF